MAEATSGQRAATEEGLYIERTFDAPVEMVWRAWSEPEHYMKWWGPRDYSCPAAKIDFRVGGRWLSAMRGADGKDLWSTGTYREIVPLRRIVTTDSFADEAGNIVPASEYGIEDDLPLEMTVTVTFEAMGGKTKLTLHHALPQSHILAGASEGWNQSLDKLAESLAA